MIKACLHRLFASETVAELTFVSTLFFIQLAAGADPNLPPGQPGLDAPPVRVFIKPTCEEVQLRDELLGEGEGGTYIEVLVNGVAPPGMVSTAQLSDFERFSEADTGPCWQTGDDYPYGGWVRHYDFDIHLPYVDGGVGPFFLALKGSDILTVRYRIVEHDFTSADDCVYVEHQWQWFDNFGIGSHTNSGALGPTGYWGDCGGKDPTYGDTKFEYDIFEWDPDLALETVIAVNGLLCATVANVGTTVSGPWHVDFWANGEKIASTPNEQSLPAGEHVHDICASNPLMPTLTEIEITGRIFHPYDSENATANDTAVVSFGVQLEPLRRSLPSTIR